MLIKLLTEHHLKFLSLKRGCTGSSESTLVKYHIVGNHMTRLNYPTITPTGRVLWEDLLEEVILHISHVCSLLHTLLKDKCVCLQDE